MYIEISVNGSWVTEWTWHFLDPNNADQYVPLSVLQPAADVDADNLTNEEEQQYGTDPYNVDTDGDGHTDGDEVHYDLTDPTVWNNFDPPENVDSDGDGIDDSSDPAPADSNNTSPVNGTSWYGDALGNSDSDIYTNFFDPAPSDGTNYSSVNSTNWNNTAMEDADDDGEPNFFDMSPFPPPPADEDNDGIGDDVDPLPNDASNPSPTNGTSWYGDALANSDGDAYANFFDPAPNDATNHSPNNGIDWNSTAMDDADNDEEANYFDSTPFPSSDGDADDDGLEDSNDPAPNDASNTSPINGVAWYGDVFGNNDADAYPNFFDPDASSSSNVSPVNGNAWGNNAMDDNDSDGQANFFDSDPNPPPPPDPDTDGDGLTDSEESTYGTNAAVIDTDGDGLTDYEELRTFSTGALDAYSIHHASPSTTLNLTDWHLIDQTDSDNDGIIDRIETFYGLNPSDGSDAFGDLDGDGVSNLNQYLQGIPPNAHTTWYDVDGDGMTTVFENFYQFNDGTFDDSAEDTDGDGLFNFEEAALILHPRSATTRIVAGSPVEDWTHLLASNRLKPNDLLTRQASGDWDADGLPDAWEHRYGLERNPGGGLLIRTPDGSADFDGDGLTNLAEFTLQTNPLIQDEDNNGVIDGQDDSDGDGLTTAQEFQFGTNRQINDDDLDSDGDGISDAQELLSGTNQGNYTTDTWGYRTFPISGSGTGPITAEDSDGDGLVDSYETTYFDGPQYRNGRHDADEDGLIDLEEAISPTVYAPRLWDQDDNGRRDVIPADAHGAGSLFITNDSRAGHRMAR